MKRKTTGPLMTKRELVRLIGAKTGLQQTVALDVVRIVFDAVSDTLVRGGHCEFRDFGVFTVSSHKARIGRNPHKPEVTYEVPGHRVVRFRAGRLLRDKVAKG
ncbi:MAG: integration host factor subunit beta [Kiritimatiellae bacterium]|nr:integration host factor subunit beta [Kiritimatiellia bacterium]